MRGVSPVVGTILLIALTVALAAGVAELVAHLSGSDHLENENMRLEFSKVPSSDCQTVIDYNGAQFRVDNGAIENSYDTPIYYYLTIKNEGSPVDLRLTIENIVNGPYPQTDWGEHGDDWLAVVVWSTIENRWIGDPELDTTGVVFHFVGDGEILIRVVASFQNERAYAARSWFPDNPVVKLKLANAGSGTVYWTPVLSWWAWQ